MSFSDFHRGPEIFLSVNRIYHQKIDAKTQSCAQAEIWTLKNGKN